MSGRRRVSQTDRIYAALVLAEGGYVSHRSLAAHLGYPPVSQPSVAQAVDVIVRQHVKVLRKQLAGSGERIVTRYRVGYALAREVGVVTPRETLYPEVVRMQRALQDVAAGLGVSRYEAVELVAGALIGHEPALVALGIGVAGDSAPVALAAIEAKYGRVRCAQCGLVWPCPNADLVRSHFPAADEAES